MTEEIWKNGFMNGKVDNSEFLTSHPFNILVDVSYRIHLEGLRLITGKSLMEILYLGEVNIQNEFDKVDNQMYRGICNRIFEMLKENQRLDITTLSLKDLE